MHPSKDKEQRRLNMLDRLMHEADSLGAFRHYQFLFWTLLGDHLASKKTKTANVTI